MNSSAASTAKRLAPGLTLSSLAIGCALWWAIAGTRPESTAAGGGAPVSTNLFAGQVVKIGIDIDDRGLKSLRKFPRKYVRATVLEGGDDYSDAAVRLKGSLGSFRPVNDKPALTVSFTRNGATRVFHGLRQIHLNNSVEDPSFLGEQIGGEIFQSAGVPAPRVTRALVELNGRPLGLYTLVEGYTEEFLGDAFGRGDGEVYDPEVGHEVDQEMKVSGSHGKETDQADREALADACAERNLARRWEALNRTLDVDRFVSFMAVEVMIGHRDGYCMARNNYRIYHNPGSDKMVFLPHGMDQLFGKADLTWKPLMAGTVARALIETPPGRQAYERRFRELLATVFQPAKLNGRIDQILAAARSGLPSSLFRGLENEALALKSRIARRRMSLEAQLAEPELTLTRFKDRQALATGWAVSDAPDGAEMANTPAPDGAPSLGIAAKRSIAASWRTKALLARGSYRFEGNARVAGVEPVKSAKHGGASLRVAGAGRGCEDLAGDSPWRKLAASFEVKKETDEVELVCELEASAGRAWFDLNSLKIVELP